MIKVRICVITLTERIATLEESMTYAFLLSFFAAVNLWFGITYLYNQDPSPMLVGVHFAAALFGSLIAIVVTIRNRK